MYNHEFIINVERESIQSCIAYQNTHCVIMQFPSSPKLMVSTCLKSYKCTVQELFLYNVRLNINAVQNNFWYVLTVERIIESIVIFDEKDEKQWRWFNYTDANKKVVKMKRFISCKKLMKQSYASDEENSSDAVW